MIVNFVHENTLDFVLDTDKINSIRWENIEKAGSRVNIYQYGGDITSIPFKEFSTALDFIERLATIMRKDQPVINISIDG